MIRSFGPSGEPVVRLGVQVPDDYLNFVAARCRPNTVLATAYDLMVSFRVVDKPPEQVSTAGLRIDRGKTPKSRQGPQVAAVSSISGQMRAIAIGNELGPRRSGTRSGGDGDTGFTDSDQCFHPSRFANSVERIVAPLVRSRGEICLANRPVDVVGWESAGASAAIGVRGERDRARVNVTELTPVGVDLDVAAVASILESCLLTDEELAAGPDCWRQLEDPFAEALGC